MRERAAAARARDGGGFQVHPANAAAVRLFMRVQTQWRGVALSTMTKATLIRTGLDYDGVAAAARLARIRLDPDGFDRLQVMEMEALTAFGEEARR
ncbi:MAG: DUF1799 domain-containing protein [Maricaulaceae bacterium]|nr:DUF1799 domain-containing protein [Maricaulaceae bacterium]